MFVTIARMAMAESDADVECDRADATSLVHEAYVRLVDVRTVD